MVYGNEIVSLGQIIERRNADACCAAAFLFSAFAN